MKTLIAIIILLISSSFLYSQNSYKEKFENIATSLWSGLDKYLENDLTEKENNFLNNKKNFKELDVLFCNWFFYNFFKKSENINVSDKIKIKFIENQLCSLRTIKKYYFSKKEKKYLLSDLSKNKQTGGFIITGNHKMINLLRKNSFKKEVFKDFCKINK